MSIRVLLIDDDQEFLDILSERLAIRGMDVQSTASAQVGLEMVGQGSYDTIVLDLQMPEMDGLETLQQLKVIAPTVQVIVLTGHATVFRGVQAMKLGAVDVLEKPVNIRILEEKIKEASVASQAASQKNASASSSPEQRESTEGFFQSFRKLFK